jgi:hypothetical protein
MTSHQNDIAVESRPAPAIVENGLPERAACLPDPRRVLGCAALDPSAYSSIQTAKRHRQFISIILDCSLFCPPGQSAGCRCGEDRVFHVSERFRGNFRIPRIFLFCSFLQLQFLKIPSLPLSILLHPYSHLSTVWGTGVPALCSPHSVLYYILFP